jgi:hypothetical protein
MTKRAHIGLMALMAFVLSGVFLDAPAQADNALTVSGRLSERDLPARSGAPARLHTNRRVLLELSVTNRTDRDLDVGTVVLQGRVVGLTFFNYETSVTIAVPPRATVNRVFSLDLASLRGQAVGLFNADVKLLDQRRQVLVSRRTAVDVRGSWHSVYSVFGVLVALVTVAAFVRAVLDLARHRLSPNRWRRAIRFFVPGLGLGLTLVFTLSAMRMFLAGPTTWMPIVAITSLVGFAMGYGTPTPDIVADEEPAPVGSEDPDTEEVDAHSIY